MTGEPSRGETGLPGSHHAGLAGGVSDQDDAPRVVPATDAQRYLETDRTVWFDEVLDAPAERQLVGLPKELRFAVDLPGAADESTYAGIYGVFPLTLSVPGPGEEPRQVPCAGLTWVGVHPDHRRHGVLTAMLRHHFEQVHADPGTHLSALHASEPAIYGRHGYGAASLELTLDLGRGTELVAPYLEHAAAVVRTELATATDPGMPARLRACHLHAARSTLGAVVGEEAYYERICWEHPEPRRDKEIPRILFARRDGVDVGCALLRRTPKWERGRSTSELTVYSMVGDPAARLALLRRLVDFDLIGTVKVFGVGTDDPELHWLRGPRGASDVTTYDSLWVRLVDLSAALAQRSYAGSCDVTVEVLDRAAPWNAGRWRLAIEGGAAEAARTDRAADLRLPVEALGSAYLGGGNLVALRAAGLVEEQTAGAAARLWRAMRTDLAPSAAIGF
jgi:GNAT superfamily N-acetyltransferase